MYWWMFDILTFSLRLNLSTYLCCGWTHHVNFVVSQPDLQIKSYSSNKKIYDKNMYIMDILAKNKVTHGTGSISYVDIHNFPA